MAINISGKPADYCPDNCPYMTLDVITEHMLANNTVVNTQTTLYCKNEEICRFHYERNKNHIEKKRGLN